MLKGLIENECGGQNPLMKLTAHFTNASEHKLAQDAIKSLRSVDSVSGPLQQQQLLQQQQQQQQLQQQHLPGTNADSFVSEYLGIDQKSSGLVPSQTTTSTATTTNTNNVMLMRRLPAPRTFHMGALLNELKQIDNTTNTILSTSLPSTNNTNTVATLNQSNGTYLLGSSNNSSNSNLANDWSQEYWSSLTAAFQKQSPLIIEDKAFKWSADYLTQTEATIFDEAWENLLMKNSSISAAAAGGLLSSAHMSNSDNNIATNQLNEEMRKTANELLDSMQDSRFSESEFLQFVRNLSVNGLNASDKTTNDLTNELFLQASSSLSSKSPVNDSTTTTTTSAAEVGGTNLASDEETVHFDTTDLATEWVKEFQTNQSTSNEQSINRSFWDDLQDEWNATAAASSNHPWLDDFQKVFDTYKTYEFDKENPLKSHPNPFDEGLERLKAHDIVNAVLLFEVAVQKEPDNMLAWQYLGTTQVENEQDAQAIRALRRCLDLKKDNLIALSTLATSYTNESMQRLAFNSLIKWLKYHPAYSYLLKNDEQAARLVASIESTDEGSHFYMATLGVVNAADFMDLQEVFLKAVRESANKIDPDLQCCLGILFHLSGEYEKAADCFKTALQIKPNDHLLWNKLGATYANNNRNEEAIDAYYQALKLCPGFVRARYNLGIGCMNLGAYKEAVEHFLTALVQQSQANLSETYESSLSSRSLSSSSSKQTSNNSSKLSNNIQQMSETIWSTLRLALSYLNRTDLYQFCIAKDLERLKQEFKI